MGILVNQRTLLVIQLCVGKHGEQVVAEIVVVGVLVGCQFVFQLAEGHRMVDYLVVIRIEPPGGESVEQRGKFAAGVVRQFTQLLDELQAEVDKLVLGNGWRPACSSSAF